MTTAAPSLLDAPHQPTAKALQQAANSTKLVESKSSHQHHINIGGCSGCYASGLDCCWSSETQMTMQVEEEPCRSILAQDTTMSAIPWTAAAAALQSLYLSLYGVDISFSMQHLIFLTSGTWRDIVSGKGIGKCNKKLRSKRKTKQQNNKSMCVVVEQKFSRKENKQAWWQCK